jgi:hypothetical protein
MEEDACVAYAMAAPEGDTPSGVDFFLKGV